MNNLNPDFQSPFEQRSGALRIRNALVEEVSTADQRTGYLIVSYSMNDPDGAAHMEQLRLNVSRQTVITNPYGQPSCLCRIQPGMHVNAEFSPAMTRSIPPQSSAFCIAVLPCSQPTPIPDSRTSIGQVLRVVIADSFIVIGDRSDIHRRTQFNITGETVILDRSGRSIPLRALRIGQWVRVMHASFMTASIPPQTTAYRIQVL